jgi:hypothetical protein
MPVICLTEITIFPSKSIVGVMDNVPVEEALGPVAPVAEYVFEVTPPKVMVNVPAVLPVTVNAI